MTDEKQDTGSNTTKNENENEKVVPLTKDKPNDEKKASTKQDAAGDKKPNLEEELAETQKDLLYLRAEFDNFRKQSIKERSDLVRFAGESLARDFLGVLDIFEKATAMTVTAENFSSFVDGVSLTEKEIKDVLSKHGIREIDCKNKLFNPTEAEALSQVPTDEVEEGHVYDVMRKGYKFHDKVIRHAQVVLATKPQEKNEN